MKKTAFVTGGTGFIGTNLIKLLISRNWRVTALYRDESKRIPLQNLPVAWVKGSITDANAISDAIPENTTAVFHMAGDTGLYRKHNKRQAAVNIDGTGNVVRTAIHRQVSVFIHTSSVAAWGDVSGLISENVHQKGRSSWVNYESTKWAGERKALEGLNSGMRVVILNPANIIGPHDTNNWGRLLIAIANNDLPYISKGCVSITHVKEIANAHLAAAEIGKSGERYILAGNDCSLPDFIKIIAQVCGTETLPAVISPLLFKSLARVASWRAILLKTEPTITPELAKLMTRSNVQYSSKKAMNELNYKIPPIRKSVRDCYRWLKKQAII